MLVEMSLGEPPFMGSNEEEQLVNIIERLGAPPIGLVQDAPTQFNLEAAGFRARVTNLVSDPQIRELAERCLRWAPRSRITAAEALRLAMFKKGK